MPKNAIARTPHHPKWPPTKEQLLALLQPVWHFREELCVRKDLLLKSILAIVTPSLSSSMLDKIEALNIAFVSLEMLPSGQTWLMTQKYFASHFSTVVSMESCKAATEPMLSHPTPTRTRQFILQDIFKLKRKHYLVTVDHYSDFHEFDQMDNTLKNTTVKLTKGHLARHGIRLRCLTDDGPQFLLTE